MSAPAAPAGTLPAPRHPSGPYRICLVCLGNICRSPMAEAVLRTAVARSGLAGQVEVDSAGTGDWHVGEPMHPPAAHELHRRGYDGSAHRARQIQRSWLDRYDLLLAMDRANLAALRRLGPGAYEDGRVQLLRRFDPALSAEDAHGGEVPDPYGGAPEDFTFALDLIQDAARGLAAQLATFLRRQEPDRP
jgi:protein-tyrosine phosphatase